ncbi:amidohydrolase family protein [bacterium]|jgi:cytosine/creatinine deaminase|nr:amidohydrolase family protein [bacterium]MBT4335259.1 amidohydrolase family protein [bacterium]MBT4763565.1 amidohydrolase family protein [bacterium]MBT5400937.1 amidohydrolase family protein [bacterium]MBT5942256.1 amidohydrolase family protein [bacterium]
MEKWNLKDEMLTSIKKEGGFVNCHAHFDKAYYIDKEGLDKTMVDMEAKWNMSDDIKRSSTQEEIEQRIRWALDTLVEQGCKLTASFIDAYQAVGHKAIDAANVVKEEYKDKIEFLTITQPLGGLNDSEARKLYEEITAKADIAGGLPSKDRPDDKENYDHLFSIAKNLGKKVHVHIDQENNPNEKDTEVLLEYAKKHNYGDKTVGIHVLSVSAQPKSYRMKIYKEMASIGMSAVVCPSAALAMRQLDEFTSPVHNSIANVPEMLEAGVVVGLGVDNVYDFYQPFVDADMWLEMRMLQEACRYYNYEDLVKIACANGKKILSN